MISATWEGQISTAGGFYIDCNDGGTHLDFFTSRAPNLAPVVRVFQGPSVRRQARAVHHAADGIPRVLQDLRRGHAAGVTTAV